MAAFRRGLLYVPPLVQCRHRGKINIQRPRPGPHERRVFEAITQPLVPSMIENPHKECPRLPRLLEKSDQKEEITPLERIILRECKEVFEKNRLIIVFHPQSMIKRIEVEVQKRLRRKGLHLKFMSNSMVKETIIGSKWENLLPLVTGRCIYGVSEDPMLSDLVKEIKKIPELYILGGVLDTRLLTRDGLLQAAALPPMDVLLGETCSLLGAAASQTKNLLSSHQQTLSANLTQYIHDQTEGATS